MKKKIINKVLMALLISTIAAPIFADPVDESANQIKRFILEYGTKWPLTAFADNNPKIAIALACIGSAIVGGVTAFTVKKIANYFKGKKYQKSSACVTYGAIGGAVTALAAVPMVYNMLKYTMNIGIGIGLIASRSNPN